MLYKIKNILIIVFLNGSLILSAEIFKIPSSNLTLELYQLMKDVDQVLTHYNIPYWVDGGTLIGTIRHAGLIPWDDDLDICIDIFYLPIVNKLKPLFENLGYKFVNYDSFGCAQIKIDKTWLDIIYTKQQSNKISYALADPAKWALRKNEPFFIYDHELYPLKRYPFGNFTVLGPNNPYPYLRWLYPRWWKSYIISNHSNKTKIIIPIQGPYPKKKYPAKPLGPLKTRTLN